MVLNTEELPFQNFIGARIISTLDVASVFFLAFTIGAAQSLGMMMPPQSSIPLPSIRIDVPIIMGSVVYATEYHGYFVTYP